MGEDDDAQRQGEAAGRLPPGPVPDAFWSDLDPEGWMSERPRYWLDRDDPEPPTRAAWLRHRWRQVAALLRREADPWNQPRTPEEEWIRLSEQALGPLPRPSDIPQERKARSAEALAPETARKPAASSPTATGVCAHAQ